MAMCDFEAHLADGKQFERYLGTCINHLDREVCAPRSNGNAKRSFRLISCFTLYAIQCLRGLGNREWMRLRSYELPVTAALCFRSDIFIQPRRQWNGHSSGCNCQAISPQLSQSDCHPLLYPLQSRERLP